MKLKEIIEELNLTVANMNDVDLDTEITGGYASDLLSQVMAKAKEGSIWLTIQAHMNIIGVASLTGIRAIVVCEGHDVGDEVIRKADEENIVMLKSDCGVFTLAGKLYSRGLR